jgi:tRNA G37 N-methylase Trm5
MDVACNAAKSEGGIVHFYSFVRASDAIDDLKVRFTKSVEKHKRKVEEALFFRLVRETAPHEWQAVLDARIK